MIIFGHNNFKIKSFTPQELRLPKEEGAENIEIQVRQRYAHLFWIPFFPIGKLYAFKRAGDSNLYELPENIKQTIKDRHKQDIRTPWYSYTLIVLALLVGLGFYADDKISDINRENSFYQEQAENEMMIKYPTTGDYYAFDAYNNETGYENTSIVLKVNSYDNDMIEFTSGYEYLYGQEVSEYNIKKEFEKAGQYIYQPTRISKEALLKMIKREFRDYSSNYRFKMPEYDNMYFRFKSLKRQELKDI